MAQAGFATYCTDVVDINTGENHLSVTPAGIFTALTGGFYRFNARSRTAPSNAFGLNAIHLNKNDIRIFRADTRGLGTVAPNGVVEFEEGDVFKVECAGVKSPFDFGSALPYFERPQSNFAVTFMGPN